MWTSALESGELEEHGASVDQLPQRLRVAYEHFVTIEKLLISLTMPFPDGSRMSQEEIRRRLNYVAEKFDEFSVTPVLDAAWDSASKASEAGKKNKRGGDDRETCQERKLAPCQSSASLMQK